MKFFKFSLILSSALALHAHAAKLVLTGDSTVATYSSGKQGWGAVLSKFLVSGHSVRNLAKGGTSTKTYISEGHWKKALAEKGKYVFIQFGHNDQSKKHTKAETTYKTNLRRMISDVKKTGGIPVIVSSPRRLKYEGSNRMSSELGPFATAAREVAAEEKVPYINLWEASKNTWVRMGEKEALKHFAKGDRTHTNTAGATVLAGLVAEEAKKDPVLRDLFK